MIYYTDIKADESGQKWLYINGDTGYCLDKWTIEEAMKDYESPEAENERLIANYKAWGYYD